MRIGVDIDGVLANSLPLWVAELNKFFNKNMRLEEIHLYEIHRTYDITFKDFQSFLEHKGRFLMSKVEPITGSARYLSKLKQQHEICIVTARDKRYYQETRDWLKNNNLPYDELLLLGSHEKKELCLDKDLQVMIEDTLEIGIKVSDAGIPVLLMDAPYNRGVLPELIYRKHSWEEIYQTITGGELPIIQSGRGS
ncbi:MAG: hypothetical protein HQP61_01655 [Peptococcaceae bacterium]|nr:hypothetical protein [Candidatus Syntrophopropionicum ammoniitolerans]